MAFRLATSARNAAANGVVDLLDAGAGAGTMGIRDAVQPTNVGDADPGNLLGTLPLSDPAFGNAATGVATANAITSDTSADASGTARCFRWKDSDGNIVADGDCGQGSGTLNFDNTTIVAGGVIACSSFTVTAPIS